MATSTRLSLLEYMKTSYWPDWEFVDGELRERKLGKWEHVCLQALLASWFQLRKKDCFMRRLPRSKEYRFPPPGPIPDVMLVSRGLQLEVAVDPPVLVVEILSPDDTYTETQSCLAHDLHMGVPSSPSSHLSSQDTPALCQCIRRRMDTAAEYATGAWNNIVGLTC